MRVLDASPGAPRPTSPRVAPWNQRRRRRRITAIVAALTLTGLVTWGIVRLAAPASPVAIPPTCTVTTTGGTYTLGVAQAANAATIASIGARLGLPDHAVTVALATALQESELYDLPTGDRDSVGLFQQRPSEGWGTRTQLLDTNYATTAFYQALERVPGWETMAVTEAAQAVQHSAAPAAYADQEAEGRALAIALTGEVPAGLSCHFRPAASGQDGSWRPALAQDLGLALPGQPVSAKNGWIMAAWLVAHSQQYGLRSVSFAGRSWRPLPGTWTGDGVAATATVQVS